MADQNNSVAVITDAPTALDGVPANYQRSIDTVEHTNLHVHGSTTRFDTETHTDDSAGGVYDNRVMELIDGRLEAKLSERKAAEDKRANKRNMNRLYLMLTVLMMELLVPTIYGMGLLPPLFIKYEVLLITAPDALLTIWALHKKY